MTKKPSMRTYRIAGLFLLGWVLFNYPVLALFNVTGTIAGVPALYAYLFAAWLAVIGLAAIVIDGPG